RPPDRRSSSRCRKDEIGARPGAAGLNARVIITAITSTASPTWSVLRLASEIDAVPYFPRLLSPPPLIGLPPVLSAGLQPNAGCRPACRPARKVASSTARVGIAARDWITWTTGENLYRAAHRVVAYGDFARRGFAGIIVSVAAWPIAPASAKVGRTLALQYASIKFHIASLNAFVL